MDNIIITIKTSKGMEFLRMADILYCHAQGRYTKIITRDCQEYFLTRVLKELEDTLPCDYFFRVHRSYLINLNYVIRYHCNHEKPITLENNVKIKLSDRRKTAFLRKIKEVTHTI